MVRKLARETELSHQLIIQNYMFERYLERLSLSRYRNNFILKGGCLLSSMMGIENRSTMDIDTNVTGITFTKEIIEIAMDSILLLQLEDDVKFIKNSVFLIKEGKEYQGFRFSITGALFNMRVRFHIDISTGDQVTPNPVDYEYRKMFDDTYIILKAYNYETVVAEKLHSILELKVQNSRMKDYFDIYYLIILKKNEINTEVLKKAIHTTFKNRKALHELTHAKELIGTIKNDSMLNTLWKNYQSAHKYAKHISFHETIQAMNEIISLVNDEDNICVR